MSSPKRNMPGTPHVNSGSLASALHCPEGSRLVTQRPQGATLRIQCCKEDPAQPSTY